jgi:hypothetical protein
MKLIIYLNKKRVLFKSKLQQMETAYNYNDTKTFYQEVSIRKGSKPLALLITDEEGNTV